MKQEIINVLSNTAKKLNISLEDINLEYPENSEYGDFSSNIALIYAKKVNMSPRDLAVKIVSSLNIDISKEGALSFVESVSIAGPGFINFKVKDNFFAEEIVREPRVLSLEFRERNQKNYSKNIIIEYTDPNIFKAFHIGHLMSNAIGESLSRLIQSSGAKVTRLCYPSDIGLHIAKSIWAMKRHENEIPNESASIQERTAFLGKMYVEGTQMYESDEKIGASISAKDDIDSLNKIIYEKSSLDINNLYEKGRKWSLEHFEELYKRLGTHFDGYIYESEMAPIGLEIVKKNSKKGIFKKPIFIESDGAIVFKGEDYGLHTRVFINSHGLPTYEAKEMGLNITKFKKYPKTDRSIVVTASEQNEYFKVVGKALTLIDRNVGEKTKHIGHGMLRFVSGKMSSRTGNVVTAETLIDDIKKMVKEKIDSRNNVQDSETIKSDSKISNLESKFSANEIEEISDIIAIGAIKYTILRQSIGSDVIFDSVKSISFEGDSGPYLQYSVVRANSIIEKARIEIGDWRLEIGKSQNTINGQPTKNSETQVVIPEKVGGLEKLIIRFPDIVERASKELAPQLVANYLINLAGEFNSFYAGNTIVNKDEPLSPYRILLTKRFIEVMTEGLHILGIKVPKRM